VAKAILGLDHVIIGVNDLEGARADYLRLGFTPAPRGDHAGRATSNYCLMFPDTYLELLGVLRPELDSGGLLEGLASRGEGLQRLALGTPDADAAKADLAAAGLHPDGPHDLARPLQDSGEMVRFRNLFIPPAETAGLGMFLCGHKTPELMRTPELVRHPNGAKAFVGITGLVADPAAAAAAMARVFGEDAVSATGYGAVVETGRGRIHLATPMNFAMLHEGAASPPLPLPSWYALRIAVGSIDATADYLNAQGVPVEPFGGGIRVDPQHARGVLLEFVAA